MGYHIAEIKRGIYGEASKIREETEEFLDAWNQGNKIMELVELSDLVGAIQGFLEKTYPGFDIYDLVEMSDATRRAFNDGTRTAA